MRTHGVLKGGRKWIVMRSKDWIWRDDENRKGKCNMTQRKCVERTWKQVAVKCDRDGPACGDPTLRNAAFRRHCQKTKEEEISDDIQPKMSIRTGQKQVI